MKVARVLSNSLGRDSDWTPSTPHGLPDSWVEARERANALPCDGTQTIGDAFDLAIEKMQRAIWRDKHVLRGIPCLRGTRIPVYQVCGMIAEGYNSKKVAKLLSLSDMQVRDALRFASILLEQ